MASVQILCIGRIKEPKGLKGQFKITAFGDLLAEIKKNQFAFNLYKSAGPRDGFLQDPQLKEKRLLTQITSYKENIFLAFTEGINTPEAVATISGLYLGITLDEANEIFADRSDPFLFQYIGIDVFDAEDEKFRGQVKRIRQHQGLNWLVVSLENDLANETQILVPLREPFITNNDLTRPMAIFQLKDLAEA